MSGNASRGVFVFDEANEDAAYAAYFHELDAWTEYWDVYHPETGGRYYLGSPGQFGLLELFVPGRTVPPVYDAWKRRALGLDPSEEFTRLAALHPVAGAAIELDDLVAGVFERHFGDPADPNARRRYLRAIYGAGTDTLPAATERLDRIAVGDPRRRTAGRHTIEADMMWFVWALQIETARVARPTGDRHDLWALLLAGVAVGSAANFALRGHRRTRPEYRADAATRERLFRRGLRWADDLEAATAEVHDLFQIREWGVRRARPPGVPRNSVA